MRDLAASLGVSHTTVNLALQGDKRVSEKLRTKIRRIAEEEGYFPNDLAAVLRTGKTGLIGFVVPRIHSDYIAAFMEPAVRVLWEYNYFPVAVCSRLDQKSEAQILERMARQRVEGLLIMPCREDSGKLHFAEFLQRHIPIVTINNPIPKLDLPMVSSDDIKGAKLATDYLIGKGHRNILHIGAPHESRHADVRREKGFREVMKKAGLTPRVLYYNDRVEMRISTADLERELLPGKSGNPATAVFCFNDDIALMLYSFCQTRGIRIPEDLSVVGYCNEGGSEALHYLDCVSPPLTTVDQNPQEIGRKSAETLLHLIEHDEPVVPPLLIQPNLVERSSVRSIA